MMYRCIKLADSPGPTAVEAITIKLCVPWVKLVHVRDKMLLPPLTTGIVVVLESCVFVLT